jgi:signal transduction histidine kinase
MARLVAFLKRHALLFGFLAVLAPLVVLLGLQFVWLTNLERMSAIAHRATLGNYLDAVGNEVQYFYASGAERALNVSPALFLEERLDEAADAWRARPVEGARRLFLVDYTRERFGRFHLYDPATRTLVTPPASDESLAIIVACTPWQMLSFRRGQADSLALRVDERDPNYRIILNPIVDDERRLVGVAGMILDEDHFRKVVLPAAIERSLPSFFPGSRPGDLIVTVRDQRGQRVIGAHGAEADAETADPAEPVAETAGPAESVASPFPFAFADWTIRIMSTRSAPERWARASFAFNLSLSLLLGVALIGGIVLALQAANRAMRLSEMKSDFVSNVSHELRTPLASIRMFAELLRLGRAASPEKVREYGTFIEAESRRLTRLINNILDFSRLESGRKTYRFARGDLREVVEGVVRALEIHLGQAGFRVTLEPVPLPLPEVRMDPDAIAQALHNLIDNAAKYSGDAREIAVRLWSEPGAVAVAVEDHGVGIPKDEQRKIFERFHRVGTGLVHEVKGSGLGLSLVRHIVQDHGGRIDLQSEPGRGSTFTIRLPAAPAAVPRLAGGPAGAGATEAAGPGAGN